MLNFLCYVTSFSEVTLAPKPAKPTVGSTSKSGTGLGSKASKSTFGSTISKNNSFGSANKTTGKTPILGSSPKTTSPFPATSSKKSYETVSYSPKTGKQSTSLGILWIPTKKRNKKKEMVYSSMNYDKKSDRAPSMYSYGQ